MAKGQAAKSANLHHDNRNVKRGEQKKSFFCRLGFSIDIHPSITLATGGEGINAFDFGLPFEIHMQKPESEKWRQRGNVGSEGETPSRQPAGCRRYFFFWRYFFWRRSLGIFRILLQGSLQSSSEMT
jgi:hypothetical protein